MSAEPVREPTRWVRAPACPPDEELTAAVLPSWLAELLVRRGVVTPADAEAFLDPDVRCLHDPELLPGLPAAVERLLRARDGSQPVAVVGDYDVDGISAVALLAAVFRACGLAVETILPHRLEEGYGFQPLHVGAAAERGCELIVTADCGSTAHPAVTAARQRGVEVIVTDHHLGTEPLPDDVIEVNPTRDAGDYPFSGLSGAGVALKLCVALADRVGREVDVAALLRVACLGTICDLVPLVGENRVIAAVGLHALANTRSVGLQALFRRAGLAPPFRASDIGYRLGPRLNAAGRLASPRPALDLMLTTDPQTAERLADELEGWNRQRQATELQVVEEATALFASQRPLPPLLCGWSETWHRGVVGIAAGRLARLFHRPTVLFSVEDDLATGSGRSISGIHLHDFLARWRSSYRRFGGHSQAVGLTLSRSRLEEIRRTWLEAAACDWSPERLQKSITFELELPAGEVNSGLLEGLRRLEPFGVGNRQPVLKVGPVALDAAPRRFGNGHLSAQLADGAGARLEVLGWGWQERETELSGRIEVLGCLEADRYHGRPVLRLVDARPWRLSGGSIGNTLGSPGGVRIE